MIDPMIDLTIKPVIGLRFDDVTMMVMKIITEMDILGAPSIFYE